MWHHHQKDLRHFTRKLLQDSRIVTAITTEFRSKAAHILQQVNLGREFDEDALALAVIEGAMKAAGEYVDNLFGLGPQGKFPITLLRFNDVYWMHAPGFDDVGFFSSREEAGNAAKLKYHAFIAALSSPMATADLSADGDEENI